MFMEYHLHFEKSFAQPIVAAELEQTELKILWISSDRRVFQSVAQGIYM